MGAGLFVFDEVDLMRSVSTWEGCLLCMEVHGKTGRKILKKYFSLSVS